MTSNTTTRFSASEPSNGIKINPKTPDLERIEAEYIKNLQQQIYFLELEANYLREEVRKSTELQPKMTTEAKRMIVKLKELQTDLDATRIGTNVKDSEVEAAKVDKERLLGKLKAAEDSYQREKRLLLDEIAQLRNEKTFLDRGIANKDSDLADLDHRLKVSQSELRTEENKLRLTESQLSQKSEQMRLMQQAVDEKRAELLRTEQKLHQSEEKYYSNSSRLGHDKIKEDLREEVRLLRQGLKEMETSASRNRSFLAKINDGSGRVSRENARLRQQILELESELDMQQSSPVGNHPSVSPVSTDVKQQKNAERQLRLELEEAKDQLKHEQETLKLLLKQEQLIGKEQMGSSSSTFYSLAQNSIAELTIKHQKLEEEGKELGNQKQVLAEYVAELQKQVDGKQKISSDLERKVHSLEEKLKDLEHLQGLHSSIQNQKWEEFGRLADSMKVLSETMASDKPRSPSSPFDYP